MSSKAAKKFSQELENEARVSGVSCWEILEEKVSRGLIDPELVPRYVTPELMIRLEEEAEKLNLVKRGKTQ